MNKRRWTSLLLAGLLMLPLAACGKKDPGEASSQPPQEPTVSVIVPVEPEPEPEPEFPYYHPLTGEGLYDDISEKRPIAVMFNNLRKALPQIGVGQADVIYEIVAEGGITRMMGVFQDLEGVGDLGSVRSARDYYVSLALGHDAIYIHAGGSPQAYEAFSKWGVTHIDFVNGPYGNMCWRDPDRRKTAGLEHSLLTSSEKVLEQMPSRFTLEHKEDFEVGWVFDEEPPAGEKQQVAQLTVPFSKYKTGHFTYDSAQNRYLIEQHIDGADEPYVDGRTGEAVAVSNVLVLFTDVGVIKGDDKGRMEVRTTGTGDGLLLRDGALYEITWQRDKRTDRYSFLDKAGKKIPLNVGPSYINIVSTKAEVTWEPNQDAQTAPDQSAS